MEILTIIAIFIGPMIAVLITRWLDDRREKNARRMDVFKTLMRTRRTPIYPEHVGSLNLIELEFAKDDEVITKWKELLNHFAEQHVRKTTEETSDSLPKHESSARNKAFNERLAQERQTLLAKLLHSMAKALDFKIEQLEIFEGGYTPQGWGDVDTAQQLARQFLIELYLEKRSLPIKILQDNED